MMYCPNCGTENPDESRFCVKCASLLVVGVSEYDLPIREIDEDDLGATVPVLRDEKIKQDIRQAANEFPWNSAAGAIQGEEATEQDLDPVFWPEETVFVASPEEPEFDEELADAAVFEDDQADDIFEQSLSGGLKLSDLDENVPDLMNEEQLETNDLRETPSVDVPNQTIMESSTDPAYEEPAPTPIKSIVATEKPRRTKILVRVAGMLIVVLAAFAAGLGTGFLYFGNPKLTLDEPMALPVVETKPPQPPAGMVYISGGEFVMGSDAGDEFSRPAHSVTVGPFFIDQTEVTNEDYERFVSATKHTPPPNWTNGEFPEGKGRFPVTGVTWYDAAEFAAWVGKRLPTEEEWEFAARGTDNLLYPWGNEWNPALANVDKRSGGIRAVGEGGKSLFGLFDMAGNAWEWTASDARSFAGGKKSPKSRLHLKIIRGGNWQSDSRTASSVFRGYYGAVGEREYNSTGFRCVRDLRKD